MQDCVNKGISKNDVNILKQMVKAFHIQNSVTLFESCNSVIKKSVICQLSIKYVTAWSGGGLVSTV